MKIKQHTICLDWRIKERSSRSQKLISFPNKKVLAATLDLVSWYPDIANYVVSDIIPSNVSFHQRKKFIHDVKRHFWDEPYFLIRCSNDIIRRCVPKVEMLNIFHVCHSSPVGGHHTNDQTNKNIFQSEYYWPIIHKDVYEFVWTCDQCQRQGSISRHHEISMTKMK